MIVAAFTPVLWTLYWHIPGRLDFSLHHHRYEKVVDELKARSSHSGEQSGQMAMYGIDAYYKRLSTNHYTITLVTADWGHVGSAGYLYVDQSPVRITGDPYQNVDAPGDLWMCGRQVAPHWWVISCHLH